MMMEFRAACLACGSEEHTAQQAKGKGSVYVRCEDCQAQTFIRTRKGVKEFTARHGDGWRSSRPQEETDGDDAQPAGQSPPKRNATGSGGAAGGPLDF
jgi:DNA-directed RNA polymerase subunit RPC12/RpoP